MSDCSAKQTPRKSETSQQNTCWDGLSLAMLAVIAAGVAVFAAVAIAYAALTAVLEALR